VSLHAAGDEVVLTVEDTGPGIPAADRELVFGRFSRPGAGRSSEEGGTGLGLAIVRSIVSAHGGSIGIRSARPHGAVFEIRLPRLADSRVTPS
jgi:two-component system OmpR family sensor kinase